MLQKTFLARCDNRACLAKTNVISGSPEDWLSNDLLSGSNTFGVTFDFFIDWAINRISPYVWIKIRGEKRCVSKFGRSENI